MRLYCMGPDVAWIGEVRNARPLRPTEITDWMCVCVWVCVHVFIVGDQGEKQHKEMTSR